MSTSDRTRDPLGLGGTMGPLATLAARVRTCWRCRREVPDGEPWVRLWAERWFHVEPPDGRRAAEPAGNAIAFLCSACDAAIWPRLRELLGMTGRD